MRARSRGAPRNCQVDTINTPSLLCVEDAIDGLRWGESVGGLKGLMARSEANLGVLEAFVASRPWAAFLAADKTIRSNTSVCLVIKAPWFAALPADKQAQAAKDLDTDPPARGTWVLFESRLKEKRRADFSFEPQATFHRSPYVDPAGAVITLYAWKGRRPG